LRDKAFLHVHIAALCPANKLALGQIRRRRREREKERERERKSSVTY
jgi:hypothetical protein